MYFWATLFILANSALAISDSLSNTVWFPMKKKPGQRRRRRRRLDDEAAHFWDVKDHPDHSAIEGADYFYAVIQLGTPPKSFDMILDTGSHLTYVPCSHTCKTCGPNHHHKPYDKDQSTSYEKLSCSDSTCQQAKFSCRNEQCTFSISYMEGSSVRGVYMKEILTLGPEVNKVEIPVAVGCIQSETKLIYGQDADGIMGLGDSPVSILNQFHAHGLPLSFGICFGSDNEGVMTFGSYHPPEIQFTKMVSKGGRESYFKVKVKEILIDGVALSVPSSAYGSSTLIDTGSSDSLIPRKVFAAFKDIMGKKVKGSLHKEREGNLCFRNSNTKEMYASIPEFVVVLENDIRITAPFPNLIYKKQKSYICTTVFEHYGQMIIGGNTMMDHFIYLDRANKRVGVAKHNCKDLKQKLYADAGEEKKENEEEKNEEENKKDEKTPTEPPAIVAVEPSSTSDDEKKSGEKKDVVILPDSNKEKENTNNTISQQIKKLENGPDSKDKDDRDISKQNDPVKKQPGEVVVENTVELDEADMTNYKPDTWVTWEFLAMFVLMITFCAYAVFNTPGAKHHYTQVATDEPAAEAFAELNEVDIDEVDIDEEEPSL